LILQLVAAICAGLFAGASVYINAVEHPARLSCGPELAVREFAPSYKRATIMQASLAVVGGLAGLIAAWQHSDLGLLYGSVFLLAVAPFTLVVIFPTNKRLLDPALDSRSDEAIALLTRWGRLHAVRSLLSLGAFLTFLWRAVNG
jgi:hypothetical protein